MIKIAIFVEGQTERIFVEKLLNCYLTHPYFTIKSVKLLGDKVSIITRESNHPEIKYYFYIVDVTGDGNVMSALLERHEDMFVNQKYKKIIALRDLFPFKRKDKCKVVNSIKKLFNEKTSFSDRLKLIFSIMEIESWFLGEYNVFSRIDPVLRPEFINRKLKINLFEDNPELYKKPSTIIKRIYRLIKKDYTKSEKQAHNICHNIDYEFLCYNNELHNRIKSFKYFLNCIDDSLKDN